MGTVVEKTEKYIKIKFGDEISTYYILKNQIDIRRLKSIAEADLKVINMQEFKKGAINKAKQEIEIGMSVMLYNNTIIIDGADISDGQYRVWSGDMKKEAIGAIHSHPDDSVFSPIDIYHNLAGLNGYGSLRFTPRLIFIIAYLVPSDKYIIAIRPMVDPVYVFTELDIEKYKKSIEIYNNEFVIFLKQLGYIYKEVPQGKSLGKVLKNGLIEAGYWDSNIKLSQIKNNVLDNPDKPEATKVIFVSCKYKKEIEKKRREYLLKKKKPLQKKDYEEVIRKFPYEVFS